VIRSLPLPVLLRILLPILIIPLLGISARWRGVETALTTAWHAIEAGENWPASLAITKAIQYMPWRMDLWERAGVLALESDQYPIAQDQLSIAAASGELSTSGYIALGDAGKMTGNQDSAVQHWENGLRSGGKEFEIHTRLAAAYRQLGDLQKAIDHLKALVELKPNAAHLNLELGLLLAATQPESALAYLTLASELDPDLAADAELLIREIRSARLFEDQSYLLAAAGQTLAAIGEWELAAAAFKESIQLNPQSADAWAYLGEALQQIQSGGLKELQTALEIDPNSVAANTFMGIYYQRNEHLALALNYFHAAAKEDQDNPALQVEIGNTLGLLGNLAAAEKHYLRAVELSSGDPQYWRSLANFYIRYEMNLRDEALAAARQAVILDDENPESLDILAQIYLLMDSPHIARRFLRRAIEIDPQFTPALLHSGLINILEGDRIAAYQNFILARQLSPIDSLTYDQAQRLLETYFP
jgi:tetratricopeptide (TPR) repeat protein